MFTTPYNKYNVVFQQTLKSKMYQLCKMKESAHLTAMGLWVPFSRSPNVILFSTTEA
jgi:hypothetical protein